MSELQKVQQEAQELYHKRAIELELIIRQYKEINYSKHADQESVKILIGLEEEYERLITEAVKIGLNSLNLKPNSKPL